MDPAFGPQRVGDSSQAVGVGGCIRSSLSLSVMSRFVLRSLLAWVAAVLVTMLGQAIVARDGLGTVVLGVLMIGPVMLAITSVAFATAAVATWAIAPDSRATTFWTVSAAYLAGWFTTVAVLAWVPPFGNLGKPVDIANAFWFGPIMAMALGLLMPWPARRTSAPSTTQQT